MKKSWTSPIYGFFKEDPVVGTDDHGRPYHKFICLARSCKGTKGPAIRRYLDTKDRTSTRNMKRHAEWCQGEKLVKGSMNSDAMKVRQGLARMKDGSLKAAFEVRGSGVMSYSLSALTKIDVR